MKKVNIREALLKLDRDSYGRYDLTTLYECAKLKDEDKVKLVQYIDAYEHPSVIGGYLESKCHGMNESFGDDDVSDIAGAEKIVKEINENEVPLLMDIDDDEQPETIPLTEEVVKSDAKDVRKYVWNKIQAFDNLTDDDSYYWDFEQDIMDGISAKLVSDEIDIPDNAHYRFSLPEVGLNFFFQDNPEYCYYVVDKDAVEPFSKVDEAVEIGTCPICNRKFAEGELGDKGACPKCGEYLHKTDSGEYEKTDDDIDESKSIEEVLDDVISFEKEMVQKYPELREIEEAETMDSGATRYIAWLNFPYYSSDSNGGFFSFFSEEEFDKWINSLGKWRVEQGELVNDSKTPFEPNQYAEFCDSYKTDDEKYEAALNLLQNQEDNDVMESINEGVGTYAIVGWLDEHPQAYDDALAHFKVSDLDKVKEEDLLDWIGEHDELYADYVRFFKLDENLDEGLWDDIKSVGKTVGKVAKNAWDNSYTKAIGTGIKKNFQKSALGKATKEIGDSIKATDTYKKAAGAVKGAKDFVKNNVGSRDRDPSKLSIEARGKNYKMSDLKYKVGNKYITPQEYASMGMFKRKNVRVIVPKGAQPISNESLNLYEAFNLTEDIDTTSIEAQLKSAVAEFMQAQGFDASEIDGYTAVGIKDTDDNMIQVEVRAELSYEDLMELSNEIDPIVQAADGRAYFEPVTSGIMRAFIRNDQSDDIADEEAVEQWTKRINNCKSLDDLREVYKIFNDQCDNGQYSGGTIDAVLEVVYNKIDTLDEDLDAEEQPLTEAGEDEGAEEPVDDAAAPAEEPEEEMPTEEEEAPVEETPVEPAPEDNAVKHPSREYVGKRVSINGAEGVVIEEDSSANGEVRVKVKIGTDDAAWFDLDNVEQLQEEFDEPFTAEDVEKQLKEITNNFTEDSGCLRCYFEDEQKFAYDVLTKHYADVKMSKDGEWFVIDFDGDKITEAVKKSNAPKWWDSQFTCKVIDAYKSGDLTQDNIDEWETEYNGGRKPNPSLGTKDILAYHINTGKDPRNESLTEAQVEKVYTKKNGDYLTKCDNGGYSAFNASGVHLGHIDEKEVQEAGFKFEKNKFDESKSIKEKYIDASKVSGWVQNSPDEKFSSLGDYKGYTYGKLVSPKDTSGWYLIDGPDDIVIGNLGDNTYESKSELLSELKAEIHRLSLDESKSMNYDDMMQSRDEATAKLEGALDFIEFEDGKGIVTGSEDELKNKIRQALSNLGKVDCNFKITVWGNHFIFTVRVTDFCRASVTLRADSKLPDNNYVVQYQIINSKKRQSKNIIESSDINLTEDEKEVQEAGYRFEKNKFDESVQQDDEVELQEFYDDDFSDEELASILGGDTKNDAPDGLETPEETEARLAK